MKRLLDVRIVRWQLKLAYVVVALMIGYPIAALLSVLGLPADLVNLVAGSLVNLGAILLGARLFRGKGEPLESARPLWQMTARPTLSERVGVLAAVSAVVCAPLIAFAVPGVSVSGYVPAYSLFSAVENVAFLAIVAILYLNSAARLKRAGVGPLEREFKPKPLLKLK